MPRRLDFNSAGLIFVDNKWIFDEFFYNKVIM